MSWFVSPFVPWFVYAFVSPNKRTNPSCVFICICLCVSYQTHKSSAPRQNSDEKRKLCLAPSSPYPKPKARRETSSLTSSCPTSPNFHQVLSEKRQPLPTTFHTPSPQYRLTRKEKSAPHSSNTTPARRWHVARAVLFCFSLMRNANSILLSGVYREGRSPCRTLKGGRGGTIRRFPPLLSLPFQRERKKHITIFIFVQTHLETGSLLSTYKKMSFSPNPKRNELSV